MKHTALGKEFFDRPATRVARELISKYLVRRVRGKDIALMITETEAYEGFDDRASHASKGETARNRVMFGEAGIWYVYLVYGMHDMLNIVTGAKGYPAAALIRITPFGGLVAAYATTTDNGTNDPVYFGASLVAK